jgi:hypothetical protein
MPSKKPWLDGPTATDRAKEKIWQGGIVLAIGVIATIVPLLVFGIIWYITIIIAVLGLFWLLAGLITYWTGYE